MTLVLDESEEVPSDLLRPLLDSIRNENQVSCFALCQFHLISFYFSFLLFIYLFCIHVLLFKVNLVYFILFSQTISPISWTLAEKVITNCAVKLKPYLMRAVESSGRALDEYAQIVTSICQNGSESPQRDHSNDSHKAVVRFTFPMQCSQIKWYR